MHLDSKVGQLFPGIALAITKIEGMQIKKSKKTEVRLPYTLNELDSIERLKAYKSFFWKTGVDPLLIKPPQEAMIINALKEGKLSTANSLLDATHLVSIRHRIPLIALNSKKISSGLVIRMAGKGEEFNSKPTRLKGKEVVLADKERILMLYPYEKASDLKLTRKSKECLLLACGVPGIQKEFVVSCLEAGYRMIVQKCGGQYKGIAVLAR
ncbi:hypothetical protein K8R43_05430 [archaeon]|nr:hypothetical protein [archaeon]